MSELATPLQTPTPFHLLHRTLIASTVNRLPEIVSAGGGTPIDPIFTPPILLLLLFPNLQIPTLESQPSLSNLESKGMTENLTHPIGPKITPCNPLDPLIPVSQLVSLESSPDPSNLDLKIRTLSPKNQSSKVSRFLSLKLTLIVCFQSRTHG